MSFDDGQTILPLGLEDDNPFEECARPFVITVPPDYNFRYYGRSFRGRHTTSIGHFNRDMTSLNCPESSRSLQSDDVLVVRTFRLRAYQQTAPSKWFDFLKQSGAVFAGTHGLFLAWEQNVANLERDSWYLSFDYPEHLFVNGDQVSIPEAYVAGKTNFALRPWKDFITEASVRAWGFFEVER